MAENDFLDVSIAQPADRPQIPERLQKLCSFAIITVLDGHPNRESMAPTLALSRTDRETFTTEVDLREYDDIAGVLQAARERMATEPAIDAYVLLVDSADETPGFPEERPVGEDGSPYPAGTPAMAMYLGSRESPRGYLVVQPYRRRRIRGGATPMGAPLITDGPESLLEA